MQIHPPSIIVKDTGTIKGRGAFAQSKILAGTLVEISPITVINAHISQLPDDLRCIVYCWGELCRDGDALAIAHGYGCIYNHDHNANLRYSPDPVSKSMHYFAVRDIFPGEELTINYNAVDGDPANLDPDCWFKRMGITQI